MKIISGNCFSVSLNAKVLFLGEKKRAIRYTVHAICIQYTLSVHCNANTNGDIHAKPPGPVQGELDIFNRCGMPGGGERHRRRKMFRLGGATKFLYNKYRLRNTSLTVIHNITPYVKVPKLGVSRPLAPPPPPRFLCLCKGGATREVYILRISVHLVLL